MGPPGIYVEKRGGAWGNLARVLTPEGINRQPVWNDAMRRFLSLIKTIFGRKFIERIPEKIRNPVRHRV